MLDSHARVLSRDTEKFPPMEPTPVRIAHLRDNAFEAAELCAEIRQDGVKHTLLVQRAQFYDANNSYGIAAVAASNSRLRAVCGINRRKPDCALDALMRLDRDAAGLRLMGRPEEECLSWLGGDSAQKLWRLCADRDTLGLWRDGDVGA